MKRALIFLDIDGVMNSVRSCVALGGYRWDQMDPVAVRLLDECIANMFGAGVDAKVVISSTWRKKHTDIGWWRQTFMSYRAATLAAAVVGFTDTDGPKRGDEVRRYMAMQPSSTKHVIFDDDSDFAEDQPLLLCNPVGGLHLAELDMAYRMLTGEPWMPEHIETLGKWAGLRALSRAGIVP